jgi:hypothetical protein
VELAAPMSGGTEPIGRGDHAMTDTNTHAPGTPGSNPASTTVDQYVAFWNAATTDEQQRLAATTFAHEVSYHAPVGVMHGVDELVGFGNQFAQNFPDYAFRPRSRPQSHHGRARLQWELVVAGTSFATGTDVLELDDHGHVTAIITFLDRAPEGFPHAEH